MHTIYQYVSHTEVLHTRIFFEPQVGDALKIYHEFRLYYPDLLFQKEFLEYHADLSMSKL